MDTKTLVKALKIAVREVIKEELTEILREGLESTINEMARASVKRPVIKANVTKTSAAPGIVKENTRKANLQFSENRFANILNQTDILPRDEEMVPSFAELMSEGYEHGLNDVSDTMSFTSDDAMNFGAGRNMVAGRPMHPSMAAPATMHDPETGRTFEVAPEVQMAMTRDYSALMKAMDKKKQGNV